MTLLDVDISIAGSHLPSEIADFLDEADSRIAQFRSAQPDRSPGFIPSDYLTVYHALNAITSAGMSTHSFCEWGSGFGVAASLAAWLDFTSVGIEIENVLVESARLLADDFELQSKFVHGSFVPPGSESQTAEAYLENNSEYPWLIKDGDDAYEKLGMSIEDFDIIYAYPWPGEEYLIERLFEENAAPGALLLMNSDILALTLRSKAKTLSTIGRCA